MSIRPDRPTAQSPRSAREASGDGYGFSDDEYFVGEDILPGKYHTDAGGTCYYTQLMNLSDDPSAIVVKERFKPTDYALPVSGGCIWEPMGVPIVHAS